MFWTVFATLLILWLLGVTLLFAGPLIHLLLVIAVLLLIIKLVQGTTQRS